MLSNANFKARIPRNESPRNESPRRELPRHGLDMVGFDRFLLGCKTATSRIGVENDQSPNRQEPPRHPFSRSDQPRSTATKSNRRKPVSIPIRRIHKARLAAIARETELGICACCTPGKPSRILQLPVRKRNAAVIIHAGGQVGIAELRIGEPGRSKP